MQNVNEMDLPYLPTDDAAFAANPFGFLATAREQHPWMATCKFGYIVHELTAIKDLLGMDKVMRTAFDGIVSMMNVEDTPWGRFTLNQMIAKPGAEHLRLRNLLAPRFTPRQANDLRQLMRSVMSRQLDEWLTETSFDFEEFASYFPISVMVSMVGAPREAIPALRQSMEALGMGFSMEADLMPKLQEAIEVLDAFSHQLMCERRESPAGEQAPDLLGLLLAASEEGNLTDRELADLLIFFFVAGYDTSKNVLTYLMYTLMDHPKVYQRCGEDLEYCKQVVEEGLRYFSPATTFRITAEAVDYRGVHIPAETMIFFPLSIAGRDPSVFADPDTFNPERTLSPEQRHAAFGRGIHMCLGQHIARAQLQEGLHLIARRITSPQQAGPIGWRPFMGTWGIKGLPIRFSTH